MNQDFLHIGYSKVKNDYFLWDYKQELVCCTCLKPLEVKFVVNTFLHRGLKDFVQKLYCVDCFKNIKRLDSKHDGTLILVRIEGLPIDAIPVLPQVLVPEVSGNAFGYGQTLSSDDLKKEDLNKLKFDRCKYAFNPNQSIMPGSDPKVIAELVKDKIEMLDKPLSIPEGIDVLERLGKSQAYSWADQDREEEVLEEIQKLDEEKHGRRLLK